MAGLKMNSGVSVIDLRLLEVILAFVLKVTEVLEVIVPLFERAYYDP